MIQLDLRNPKMLALYLATILLIITDTFIEKHHYTVDLQHYPGYWAAFGLVGALILIITAKILLKPIMKPEDYYD